MVTQFSPQKPSSAAWSGRFSEPVDQMVQRYTASIPFDYRLAEYDIQGSLAHAEMLHKVGLLTQEDWLAIQQGLRTIEAEISTQTFTWSLALEDVHLNIEKRLTDLIGEPGKRLHTARSRNDQVVTDLRLYIRASIDRISLEIRALQRTLVDLAERHTDTILPGLTHLQIAQPITFGHHLLAYYEMLERDAERLLDCRKRVNQLPLGASALAGTSYPIDRAYVAELLGFSGVCANSLDAVSDRDFAIEFVHVAALTMTHLSRLAEELIFWMHPALGFIELADGYCTGSSIMPQKKNPDIPELVRGKTGRINGHLIALLTLMKGQPLAYNKDNQEDKEPLFDTVDTLSQTLPIFREMLATMTVYPEKMRAQAEQGYATATDLADYLVRKGLAFRDAHEMVAQIVRYAIEQRQTLAEIALPTLQNYCSRIDTEVYAVLTLEGSIQSRNHLGGTAPQQVQRAVATAKARLAEYFNTGV